MKIEKDEVVFATGKRRYAYGGILGLREGRVTYGYDGTLWPTQEELEADAEDEDRADWLTKEELIELGEYMVGQWAEFLDRARTGRL